MIEHFNLSLRAERSNPELSELFFLDGKRIHVDEDWMAQLRAALCEEMEEPVYSSLVSEIISR